MAALVLGSGFAVSTGRGVKGKVINVIIILVCMGAGASLGYAMGLGRGNLGRVPGAAIPFAIMFGAMGAIVCVAKDSAQTKE